MLPLRLYRHRAYGTLLTAGFFFQVAALPVGILLPLYFQYVRGHSATVSGLLLLPLLAGMAVGNRATAAAVLRSGRTKPPLVAGAGLLTAGTAAFFALDAATPPALTGLWLLLAGLGTGPAMGGITIATQNSVPRADMGTATAGAALTKQIGGAFGLAVAQTLSGRGMAPHPGSGVPVAPPPSAPPWPGPAAPRACSPSPYSSPDGTSGFRGAADVRRPGAGGPPRPSGGDGRAWCRCLLLRLRL